ncbi:MAG: MerR family transcriptional regulator [Nannocystaceae bacterium]
MPRPRRPAELPAPSLASDKRFFKIGEAAAIVGVTPHVLRFWEGEFPALRPEKSGGRQRVYSRADVELLLKIRHLLYAEKFTIAGARRRLEGEPEAVPAGEPAPIYQARSSLRAIQGALAELRALVERGGDPDLDADPRTSLRERETTRRGSA